MTYFVQSVLVAFFVGQLVVEFSIVSVVFWYWGFRHRTESDLFFFLSAKEYSIEIKRIYIDCLT